MKITKETLVSYDEYLSLPGCKTNKQKLLEILDALINVNSEGIPLDCISSLFCHVVSKFNEEGIKSIAEKIWNAFCNINAVAEHIRTAESSTTEERILLFLHDLVNDEEQVSDKVFEYFTDICGELEEIKLIFILQNEQNKHYFPIGSLLKKVMSSYRELERLDDKIINTFILAMEMFKLEQDINNIEALNKIVKDCNLEGLKILFKGNQLINTWKENLKYNGILVLIDKENHQIYIRSEDKGYFNEFIDENKLHKETNFNGKIIAYYLLKDYPVDAEFLSLNDILNKAEYSLNDRLYVIEKAFCNKYYNVLYDNCFFKDGNIIKFVNEFSNKDRDIICGGNHYTATSENLFKYGLRKYGLNTLWGHDVDYVMYASLFRLMLLHPLSLKELISKMNSVKSFFQDTLISFWLEKVNNVNSFLLNLTDSYFNDINYIRHKNDIEDKRIEDIYWLPYKFPVNFIINKINSICKTEEKDFKVIEIEGRKTINDEIEFFYNKQKIENKFLEKSISNNDEHIYYGFKKGKKYYINDKAIPFLIVLSNIHQKNEDIKSKSDLAFCKHSEIKNICEKMQLQKDALIPKQMRYYSDFNTIATLRIIHHVIFNSFDKNKWNILYKSLEKHQIVSYFEAIENNSFYFDEEGTLYVPKEDRSQCGTLSEINDYIRDKTRRDLGLYINQLKINDGLYCLDDTEIKKIVFVFDTLQSGTSTKDYLNLFFYPDENSKKKTPKYYCEEKEISLKQIIETNKPKIQILFLYATEEGKQNIKDYLGNHEFIKNAEIICLQNIDVAPVDERFCNSIQEIYDFSDEREIPKPGFYPIIREFNQPKKNIFPSKLLNPDSIASLFVKKPEL